MTREIAKSTIRSVKDKSFYECSEVIDKIYDYFDNRVCKLCKYAKPHTLDAIRCNLDLDRPKLMDYGCNKWEGRI